MPHGLLPPRPILVLPEPVAAELVLAGLAASTPDPTAQPAGDDWLPGVVQVTGTVASALTITGPAGPAIRSAAGRLHRWNADHPMTPAPDAEPAHRLLTYTTGRGRALLDLGGHPTKSELEEWLTAAYAELEEELHPGPQNRRPEEPTET